MDRLARLIVACLVLLFAGHAHAIGSVGTGVQTIWTCNGATGASPTEACAAILSGVQEGPDRVVTQSFTGCTVDAADSHIYHCGYSVQTCIRPQYGGGCGGITYGSVTPSYRDSISCDKSAVNVGTPDTPVCGCPLGTKPAGNSSTCVPYTCGSPGTYSAVTQPDELVTNAGDTMCDGGCGFQPSGWSTGADGRIWARWPYYATGKACGGKPQASNPLVDSGQQNTDNPAPVACGSGMCPGQVNGANVCVACSSTTVQGPSSSSSAPAGSASGADGTTSSTSTSCNGQTCTTTTTTTSSSTGQVVGQQENTQDQKSWCQQNPTSPICKDSLWGGSCGGGFTCDGDAIQCAIARQTYKTACEWETRVPVLNDAGDAAIAGGLRPTGHPALSPDSVPMDFGSSISQQEYFAGGCLSDLTVSLGVGSVTVPFSRLCSSLNMLGQIMVGLCMLAAAFITFRS